jgi:prephenate dehydrogenase
MEKVAILGPGLLGGSLAFALRNRTNSQVAIWARRADAAAAAQQAGAAHFASDNLRKVVEGADTVVLCTPIGVMSSLARELAVVIADDVLVTDVGSVKASVTSELGEIFAGRARFVGSHPMAGSEQTGIEAARADLFEGALCIITPVAATPPSAIRDASTLWQTVGCTVTSISPEAHDQTIALVSHLPHLVAATLITAISEAHPAAFAFAGPGLRDATRIASGPPAMWMEILHANRDAVRRAGEAMIEKLGQTVKLLDQSTPTCDLQAFLTRAKTQRDTIRFPK